MTGTITLLNKDRTQVPFDTEDQDSMAKAEEFFTVHTGHGVMAFNAETQERITGGFSGVQESSETLLVPPFVGG